MLLLAFATVLAAPVVSPTPPAAAPVDHATPIDLAALQNADVLAAPGDDAVCLRGPAHPKAPAALTIPVGVAAETLDLHWFAEGPIGQGALAAQLVLVFADGATTLARATLGDQVTAVPTTHPPGPAPTSGAAPGRNAVAEVLGTRPGGAPLVGSAWTIVTGRPDTVVTELRIVPKLGSHALCIVALDAGPAPRGGVTRTDTHDWYSFLVGPLLDAPLPQSAPIEAPAGIHGAVGIGKDGHLVFADGTRARFWGVDIYRQWALPAKEDADAYAATLADLGFNMVRLHHIDEPEQGLVNPKRGQPGQPLLVPEVADRLDFFLSRLKAHGIYLFLETATQRTFSAADGVANPGGVPNGHKLVPMWEDDWLAAHLAWFEGFWGRTNPYTKLRYADDPMVAIVELSNEHSLLASWGGGTENLPTAHVRALDARWNAWLRARYADDAALAAAWKGGARGGLSPGESLTTDTVRRDPTAMMFASVWPEQRVADLQAFYTELEQRYYDALAAKAKALGFTVPIVPTLSYGRPDVQQLQLGWPVADRHMEWDEPRSRETVRDESAIASPRSQGLLEDSAWAVAGKAFAVSELNHPFPNRYMAEAPLLWATIASVQDWDILLWNAWTTGKEPAATSSLDDQYEIRDATVKLAQMATASTLFRTGAVPAATGRFAVHYTPAAARLSGIKGANPLPVEISEIPFFLANQIRSSFGEVPPATVSGALTPGVGWWATPGVLVLDQPTVQARVGPPTTAATVYGDGAGPTEAGRLRVALAEWAAVSLASVDGQPLARCRHALLTVATRQENTGMAFAEGGTVIRAWGEAPVLIAPAVGTIRFQWPVPPQVHVLGPGGKPGAALPVKAAEKGWWSVALDATVRSPWLAIEDR